MIDHYSVMNAVRAYYLPQATDGQLVPLCEAAAAELSQKIRDGASHTDIRLINAAAAAVYYRYCFLKVSESDGIESFSAGDVKVGLSSGRDSIERAERERDDAMKRALPLLVDEEFYFGQVSV